MPRSVAMGEDALGLLTGSRAAYDGAFCCCFEEEDCALKI